MEKLFPAALTLGKPVGYNKHSITAGINYRRRPYRHDTMEDHAMPYREADELNTYLFHEGTAISAYEYMGAQTRNI